MLMQLVHHRFQRIPAFGDGLRHVLQEGTQVGLFHEGGSSKGLLHHVSPEEMNRVGGYFEVSSAVPVLDLAGLAGGESTRPPGASEPGPPLCLSPLLRGFLRSQTLAHF